MAHEQYRITEARHYQKTGQRAVRCTLCPHMCVVEQGETGLCRARTNRDGVLVSDNYGVVTSLCADPIEKSRCITFFRGVASFLLAVLAVISDAAGARMHPFRSTV